ncbi:MAG: hypothetical protein COB60_05690 [Flavobacteriaceae bacterium]|nr:MAG: hypothetical protein COB60_05690 [Flavobacteriaceae bacterium]
MKKIVVVTFLFFTVFSNAQSLSKLYKNVNSSVVVIETVSLESDGYSRKLTPQNSHGSGVLISKEGLIWTAAHVIQSAENVTVEFLDGDVYDAEVLISNPSADVALIKIGGEFLLKNKKIVPIGDSDKLNIGDDVFVLGAPHGFKQSLSKGVLSGRHFPNSLSNDFIKMEFLQSDAAINPGNSGGPMFNMKGEVIGIVSRIYTESGGFEGIGFAVSSNIAKKLLSEEKNLWVGMESLILTGDLARALNVPGESGLLILRLSSKGAANKLGLKGGYIPAIIDEVELLLGGDIILEIAGIKFKDENSGFLIKNKLATYKKGDMIEMTVLRNGKIGVAQFPKQ